MCFYPRHPRGWRRDVAVIQRQRGDVSIHATLAGGDSIRSAPRNARPMFLSTPPSRVATPAFCNAFFTVSVSIHATLAGGDSRAG